MTNLIEWMKSAPKPFQHGRVIASVAVDGGLRIGVLSSAGEATDIELQSLLCDKVVIPLESVGSLVDWIRTTYGGENQ